LTVSQHEQIEHLYELCLWRNRAQFEHGDFIASTLLGSLWVDADPELIARKPLGERSAIENLRLYYGFVDRLYRFKEDERSEQCLSLAIALEPHPTIVQRFLTDWTLDTTYNYPDYGFAWHLVNLGLYWARQQADAVLFGQLLEGVEFDSKGHFVIDDERSPLPARMGYSILLQHQIRGLVAFAPASCERAEFLRQRVDKLTVDAEFDVYKWEREFPVDLFPVSLFPRLKSLEVKHAAPLLNKAALDDCPELAECSFEWCRKPWSKDSTWQVDQLVRAVHGEPAGTQFGDTPYIDLVSGELLIIQRYGDSETPPLSFELPFAADSDEAEFVRTILSKNRDERLAAMAWARQCPERAVQVVKIDSAGDNLPVVALPNTRLTTSNSAMTPELFHAALLLHPESCQNLRSFRLHTSALTGSMKYLAELPSLVDVQVLNCEQLTDLSAFRSLVNLETLDLGRATALNSLSALADCKNLRRLELRDAGQLDDLAVLGQLPLVRDLCLVGLSQETCEFLPSMLRLKSIELSDMSALRSTLGLERITPAEGSRLLRIALRNNVALTDLVGVGHLQGVSNLQLNLDGCVALKSFDGLERLQSVNKLLLRLEGCTSLVDLSALNQLSALTKLHIQTRDDERLRQQLSTLHLSEHTKLIINEKPASRTR